MSLSEFLEPDCIVVGLAARTRAEVLKLLAERCAARLGRDPGPVLRALADREALGSTGVGAGVAMPHAAIAALPAPLVMVARLATPIDWQAIDDVSVDLVVMVLQPLDGAMSAPNPMARFARRLRSADLRSRLRAATTLEAFHHALIEGED